MPLELLRALSSGVSAGHWPVQRLNSVRCQTFGALVLVGLFQPIFKPCPAGGPAFSEHRWHGYALTPLASYVLLKCDVFEAFLAERALSKDSVAEDPKWTAGTYISEKHHHSFC